MILYLIMIKKKHEFIQQAFWIIISSVVNDFQSQLRLLEWFYHNYKDYFKFFKIITNVCNIISIKFQ